uniref:RIN4 pathogenic type III effector avirulence factor Avr cleavage site domain-containing protein n=1 Tax=Kalanchoe fedtschenkoi TaxID=63787 RepID=A0A7N0VF58_KALFE
MASQDKGRPLPKFGEWDVNNPASAEGFTVIFNKARNDKKTGTSGGGGGMPEPRPVDNTYLQHDTPKRRWFCCG